MRFWISSPCSTPVSLLGAAFLVAIMAIGAEPVRAQHPRPLPPEPGPVIDRSGEPLSPEMQARWKKLTARELPEWLLDAKFGIFAHWGIYSIGIGPAWLEKRMYNPDFQKNRPPEENLHDRARALIGKLENANGYKDLAPFFQAENWDPGRWADLVDASGARYAGFSIGHHDGFGLWDSDVYDWHVGHNGPQRDLYGDFVEALRKRDIKIVASSHMKRTRNWMLPPKRFRAQAKKEGWDVMNPLYSEIYPSHVTEVSAEEFEKRWYNQMREVIDRYHPDVMWFDGGNFRTPRSADLIEHYFEQADERGQAVHILNKTGTRSSRPYFNFPYEFGVLDFETGRDRPVEVGRPWTDHITITGRGWNYTGYDGAISATTFLRSLIDAVARGGGVFLSLAPRADGTIPEAQKATLRKAGDWLEQNGDAIFATRRWTHPSDLSRSETAEYIQQDKPGRPNTRWQFEEMPPGAVRYTQSKDSSTVYVLTMGIPPEDLVTAERLGSKSFDRKIAGVRLLGYGGSIEWKQKENGLVMSVPETLPNELALAFRVRLAR